MAPILSPIPSPSPYLSLPPDLSPPQVAPDPSRELEQEAAGYSNNMLPLVITLPILLLYFCFGLFWSHSRCPTPWRNRPSEAVRVQAFIVNEEYPAWIRQAVSDAASKGNWRKVGRGVVRKLVWHFGWAGAWGVIILWEGVGRFKLLGVVKRKRGGRGGQEDGMQGNRQKSDGDGGGDGDGDGDEEEKGEEDNAENEEENLTRIVIRSRPPRPVRSTQPAIRKETSVRGTKTTCTTETTTTEPEAQSIAEANKSEDITVAEVASDDDEDPDPDSDDNDVDASSSSSDESFHGELNEPRIKYYTVNPLGIIIIPERGASSPPSSLIGTRLSPSPTPPDRAAQSEEGVMMAGPILPERRSSKYVVTGSIGSTGCESGGLGKEWTRGMSLLRLGTILEEEEEEEEENAGEGSGMTTACKHEEDKEEQDMTQPSDTSVSGAVEREESMPEILVRPERTWSRV